MGRAEFSRNDRFLIAQRAGYRCSFPGCDRLTIGPGKRTDQSLCIGIAAHIYSAAAYGPRGTGGLTEEELKSPVNAIWLCGNHASLIDKHHGFEYPAERLHVYKALHESRIARELSGTRTPFTWINRLRVSSSPIFAEPTEIEFSQLTFIVGQNSVGKTALCQWIASTVHAKYLERWSNIPLEMRRLKIEVEYSDPSPHTVRVSFPTNDAPEYILDDRTTVISVAPIKIVFPLRIRNESYRQEPSDLALVSRAMDLHKYEVISLCKELNASNFGYFRENWFEDGDGKCILNIRQNSSNSEGPIPFRQLGHSTSFRFLMELGMLAAKRFSSAYPTLLVLDSGFYLLDAEWANRYIEFLVSPQFQFQSIITLGPGRLDLDTLKWVGWNAVWLEGRPPEVVARTTPRLLSVAP